MEEIRNETRIPAYDTRLQYTGRIDFSDPSAPLWIWPATSVRLRVLSSSLRVLVENRRGWWDSYLGAIVDGEEKKYLLPERGEQAVTVFEGLPFTVHDVLIFKRQDTCHHLILRGFFLPERGALLPPPERPARRMEVFGDSVSAGEVSEAVAYCGKPDPEHTGEYSNVYRSYSWYAARMLGAELHDTAQGGIALLNGTGYYEHPEFTDTDGSLHPHDLLGMDWAYRKLNCNPQLGPVTDWDFSGYTPQLVVVAIGQNDNHPDDYMSGDYACEKAAVWRNRYEAFIRKLRAVYPRATILLTTTILCHDEKWDRSIDEVCARLNDPKIRHFLYSRNGRGTPGHIRAPEAEQMARELADYVNSMGDIWNV